jgi:hypothetical protein
VDSRHSIEGVRPNLREVFWPYVTLARIGPLPRSLAVTLLSLLFVPGMAVVMLLPETKDQPLPE